MDGEVICGDIKELTADDVRGFRQFHAFCGGDFWSLALQQAGWRDDRPVWTGSCPCPSFSAAGKGRGFDDARHLWPEWFRLIRECRPATVFGEQVDAAIGHGWLDLVGLDLEGEGYAIAAAVLPAASVGAPHKRNRLFFCADTTGATEWWRGLHEPRESVAAIGSGPSDQPVRLGDSGSGSHPYGGQPSDGDIQRSGEHGLFAQDCGTGVGNHSAQRGLPMCGSAPGIAGHATQPSQLGVDLDALGARLEGHFGDVRPWRGPGWLDPQQARSVAAAGATRGFWADCDWWYGRDGKYRPIGQGINPLVRSAQRGVLALASGSSGDVGLLHNLGDAEPETAEARVARLRLYGDAICVPVAAEFIRAYKESRGIA